MSKEFICKGCGEKFNKDMQSSNVGYCYICNEFYMRKQASDLEAKLAESEKLKENYDILRCQHKSLGEFCDELKQQLAEKEKEYKESVEKILSSRDKFVLEYSQDKISFAVEQLEKAKEKIKGYEKIYIDNQIKQLKEGK